MAEHRKTVTIGLTALALGVSGCEPVGGPEPAPSLPSKSCYPAALGQQSPHLEDASFHVGRAQVADHSSPDIENVAVRGYARPLYDAEVKTAAKDAGDCSGPAEWSAHTVLYGPIEASSTGPTKAELTEAIFDTQVRPTTAPAISCPGVPLPDHGKAINVTVANVETGQSMTATLELRPADSTSHDCYYEGQIGTNPTGGIKVTRGQQVIMQVPQDTAKQTGAIPADGTPQQMRVLDSSNRQTTSTIYR